MVLKTLETLGPLPRLAASRGASSRPARTTCPSTTARSTLPCSKLEQEGYVASEWGVSDNNRKAKFYRLTRAGRKQLEREAREWERHDRHPRPLPHAG